MPEVERPKFRKDAKPTERSFKGKGVGDLLHFVKLAKRLLKGKGDGARRRDSAVLEGLVVGQSLSLATDKAERILNILKSQSKTIYDRSSLVAIQLPLLKGAKNVVQGEGIVRFWKGWWNGNPSVCVGKKI